MQCRRNKNFCWVVRTLKGRRSHSFHASMRFMASSRGRGAEPQAGVHDERSALGSCPNRPNAGGCQAGSMPIGPSSRRPKNIVRSAFDGSRVVVYGNVMNHMLMIWEAWMLLGPGDATVFQPQEAEIVPPVWNGFRSISNAPHRPSPTSMSEFCKSTAAKHRWGCKLVVVSTMRLK